MSLFRVYFGIVARSKGGSCVRRAAYQNGEKYKNERYDESYNYQKKSEEVTHRNIIGADDSFTDSSTLWNAVEKLEKRKDAQLSRTMDVTIPHSVPQHLHAAFAEDMFTDFVRNYGFIIDYSIHKADHTFDDGNSESSSNYHIHAQMTLRPYEGNGNFGKKDRAYNNEMLLASGDLMKERFANRMNNFLYENNIEDRVKWPPEPEGKMPLPEAPKPIIREIKKAQLSGQELSPKAQNFMNQLNATRKVNRANSNLLRAFNKVASSIGVPLVIKGSIKDGLTRLRMATESLRRSP